MAGLEERLARVEKQIEYVKLFEAKVLGARGVMMFVGSAIAGLAGAAWAATQVYYKVAGG